MRISMAVFYVEVMLLVKLTRWNFMPAVFEFYFEFLYLRCKNQSLCVNTTLAYSIPSV